MTSNNSQPRITFASLTKQLFWASRPVSWINTAYPFAMAYWMVSQRLDGVFFVGTLFFLIPYNLLMYGINDVFDFESDMRNPRKGGIEGSVLNPRWHKPTLWVSFLLPIPFLAYLVSQGNPASVAMLALFVFTVIAYSAKGMRFKEIPLVDSITSASHFVGPMLVGLAYAGFDLRSGTSLKLTTAFALWGMASHAFGAVQDIRADREAKISSIATAFGAKGTVWFALMAYLLAGLILLTGIWPIPLAAVAAAPYLWVVWPFRNLTDADCEQANLGWRRFIWLNFAAGFVVTMVIIYAAVSAR